MKILTVAIPNHHFFQWVNQLEGAGYEVFWFDVTDGGPLSPKIPWVTQIKGWKLRWYYPLRTSVKSKLPELYKWIQKRNENDVGSAFARAYQEIQPDIVHCFEMQLAGLPILSVLQNVEVPLIYSSWGSDLFDYKRVGISHKEVKTFLSRTHYLITDCKRDQVIASANGFTGDFLGVFPGNGGIDFDVDNTKLGEDRNTILIKGYEDGVGKASVILEALELLDIDSLIGIQIIIYSADRVLLSQIQSSKRLSEMSIKSYHRQSFIPNTELLKLMGSSILHIANSISDGMPNAMLEAMAMGAFPIQSNPGKATEEVINDGKNGYLIQNPLNAAEIASLIEKGLRNKTLRASAQKYNISFINTYYNRSALQPQIVGLYHHVYNNHQL